VGTLPVIWEDDLFGGMDEARLSIGRGVKDLARKLIGRGHDDETAWGIAQRRCSHRKSNKGDGHVKYANSAQVTGIPLTHVTLHGRFE